MLKSKYFSSKTVSNLIHEVFNYLKDNNIKNVSDFDFKEEDDGYSVNLVYEVSE